MTAATPRFQSVVDRITHSARAADMDVNRLRRQVAFHRLMARLATSDWVLKGGFCLEARLEQARATKDIDLVRPTHSEDADSLVDDLETLVGGVDLGDDFDFLPRSARRVRSVDDPGAAWRVKVDAVVDGRFFEQLTVDVVEQFDEVRGAVETLEVPPPVTGLDHSTVRVAAVDVYQHAAEKLHAIGRLYAGERVSSRVKDLVDLALLLEAGLLPDPAALAARVRVVYAERDGAAPPDDLPAPPPDWAARYSALVADLDLSLTTSDTAHEQVADLYRAAITEGRTR